MERDKVLKRRLLPIELIVLLVIYVLLGFFFINYRHLMRPRDLQVLTWPGGLVTALQLSSTMSTFLLIILVGTLTGQEYSWRTLQLWLSHGIARPLLLVVKLLVLCVPLLLMVLVSLCASAVVTALLSLMMHGVLPMRQVNVGEVVLGMLRTCYALLPYTALTFMLAVVGRSPLVAVGGGLMYVAVIEPILMSLFGLRILVYLPGGLMRTFLSQNTAIIANAAQSTPLPVSPAVSAIGIALYTVIFCGIAVWAFQRQDLTN